MNGADHKYCERCRILSHLGVKQAYKRQAWCLEERLLGSRAQVVESAAGCRLRRGWAECGAAVLLLTEPAVAAGAQKLHNVFKADFFRRELCTQAGSSLPAPSEVEVAAVLLALADGVGGAGLRLRRGRGGADDRRHPERRAVR